MTNTESLPTVPHTPRARTALRDLFAALADSDATGARLSHDDAIDLLESVRVLREEASAADRPPVLVARSVKVLSAGTDAQKVTDTLAELTDGSFEVIAAEVYDHSGAIAAAGPLAARRFGVDEGSPLGVWVLGPTEDVYMYLQAHELSSYNVLYSAGLSGH